MLPNYQLQLYNLIFFCFRYETNVENRAQKTNYLLARKNLIHYMLLISLFTGIGWTKKRPLGYDQILGFDTLGNYITL